MQLSTFINGTMLAALMLALSMGALFSAAALPAFAQGTTTPVEDPAAVQEDASDVAATQQATTPSLPSAGTGGNAGATLALLAVTGLGAALGSLYLLHRARRA